MALFGIESLPLGMDIGDYRRNSLYFVTNQKDSDGFPVVAIVQLNKTDNEGTPMHKIVSVYGMNNVLQYMQGHLVEGSRYIIQNKIAFSNMAGAQCSMTEADFHRLEKRYTEIVAPTEEDVNPAAKNSIKYSLPDEQTETDAFKKWFGDIKGNVTPIRGPPQGISSREEKINLHGRVHAG